MSLEITSREVLASFLDRGSWKHLYQILQQDKIRKLLLSLPKEEAEKVTQQSDEAQELLATIHLGVELESLLYPMKNENIVLSKLNPYDFIASMLRFDAAHLRLLFYCDEGAEELLVKYEPVLRDARYFTCSRARDGLTVQMLSKTAVIAETGSRGTPVAKGWLSRLFGEKTEQPVQKGGQP